MSRNTSKAKKKHKAMKHTPTSYADVHHAIDKNDNKTDYISLLREIKDDKVLTGYGHTYQTLIYHAATKPNIRALKYLIKECKKRFSSHHKYNISSVLNRGHKSQKKVDGKKYPITPLSKILLTLRKEKLTGTQRLEYRHMALLLIGNGVDVNCKSKMEPHKLERKSATDYQIVEPIEIAFSLYDAEIFLAIMFRNIMGVSHEHHTDDQNPLVQIQRKIHKLWYNEYDNASASNLITLICNDCSLAIFAEALRYCYILKPKQTTKTRKTKQNKWSCPIKSVIDGNMLKYHKIINNAYITQVNAMKMYYDSPKTISNWLLAIHLTYDPYLEYHPCFDKNTYHKERKGLNAFIAVLPTLYNLRQLHITWLSNKTCFQLLRALNRQCTKYGSIHDLKLDGFTICPQSMHWLSDSIVNWQQQRSSDSITKWQHSAFGVKVIGYLRTQSIAMLFPIDIVFTIYRYCLLTETNAKICEIDCVPKFKELHRLSLVNVGLNNECIRQLCHAMQTSQILKIKKLILNRNMFNVVGLANICRFIEETDCIHLNHLEIKDCHGLDLERCHYPLQIFLLIMSCIKKYRLVVGDVSNERKHGGEESYDSICECLFRRYRQYFVDRQYISHHLFPSRPKLKRKKPARRAMSATFGSGFISALKSPKSPKLPRLNQSITEIANINRLHKRKGNDYNYNANTMPCTPKKELWNERLNDIVSKCNKMTVKMGNENNVCFEQKKGIAIGTKTAYRLPMIRSSNDLSAKLYFERASTTAKIKNTPKQKRKHKLGNHSYDLPKIRETQDFLKYDAENKYLYIHIESIEHILIEFDRISAFDIKYLYIKLSEKQNCTLVLSNGEGRKDRFINKIDYMFCVENAKKLFFDTNCKIQTTQMWLKNNKIIQIEARCSINTVTSWYYNAHKITNKGTLKHISHCFVVGDSKHANSSMPTLFRNEKKITTHGYFYCNLHHFENINGQITTNVIHHINSDRYIDNNGKTKVFGIALYEINGDICLNGDGYINGDVLLFDVGHKFNLNSKSLTAQKHCFIRCNDEIKLEGKCKIKIGRNNTQLIQDIFKQNHSKIFGHNYDRLTRLASNRATPLLWIKSASFIANGAVIKDVGHKYEAQPLLKCVIAFDVEKSCDISNLHLSSNNKVYLLNTQCIKIISSTFDTNEFYVNSTNGIQCDTAADSKLHCTNNCEIEHIQIESSTINSNALYMSNVKSIEFARDTRINCSKALTINATEKLNVVMSKIKIINDMADAHETTIDITTPSLVIDNGSVECTDDCVAKLEVCNDCNINHSSLSADKLYLLKAQNIEIESSNISATELYMNDINSIVCHKTDIYYLNNFQVENAKQVIMDNGCKLCIIIKEDDENIASSNCESECILDIKDLFSIQGEVRANNMKITSNECNINGSVMTNILLLIVKERIRLSTKDSIEISDAFSLTLNGANIVSNDKDLLIEPESGDHASMLQLCIGTGIENLLSIQNSTLASKGKLDVSNIENVRIEATTMNVNQLCIHNIDVVECTDNGNIKCFNTFDMDGINQFKMTRNSTLHLKTNPNINDINKASMEIENVFFLDNTAEIHCSFACFGVLCKNIQFNGKVFIDCDHCKFKMHAYESLYIGKTCQFLSESLSQNNTRSIVARLKSGNDIINELELNNSFVCFCCDQYMQIHGSISGKTSLFVMECDKDINVGVDCKLNLYCLFIKSGTKIDFSGNFDNKHGELGLFSITLLNMDRKSSICSAVSSFYGNQDVTLNGNIKSNEIAVYANNCDIKTDCIVSNELLLEIKKRLKCSGAMTANKSGMVKCNECVLDSIALMVEPLDNDGAKLMIEAVSLCINNGEMIGNIAFDVSNNLKMSNSRLTSKTEINILNATNVLIGDSSTICANTLGLRDIDHIQCNKDSTIKCWNKVHIENVNDFKMNDNSALHIEYCDNCDIRECIIQTNNLFFMDNASNIYCSFKCFEMKSNDKIEINGKIWIKESCKFTMNANSELLIASNGVIKSNINYVKPEKTKFLQKKRVNEQDLWQNVNMKLQNDYYIHLFCSQVTNIYGSIVGEKSLVIIDAKREINIFDNGRVNGGETYMRCMNNITFSGTIDNETGDCFLYANNTLHLKEQGKIFLLFLSFDAGYVNDECYSKTALNMSIDDMADKLSKISQRINSFDAYKGKELNKFSKKIKLENAKNMFKFYDKEINATIDKTGLDEQSIGKFLKLMNKLLFMTLQQQQHLILLDVKLSKFITLINNEFDYKLSMESYFEEKNLSLQFVSKLHTANFDELAKLICKNENEFETKILAILGAVTSREQRELKKICLKHEIWQKYQYEKEKIVTESVAEICPILSAFFNEINDVMKQTQNKALGFLRGQQKNSLNSLEVCAKNMTQSLSSTATKSLNVIANFRKNNKVFHQNESEDNKHKFELLIGGFLRAHYNNHNNLEFCIRIFEILKENILNYCYVSRETKNSGILKSKAFTLITGIEECCSEIIGNQQQMTQSILFAKSILKFKPKTFKKQKKKRIQTLKTSEHENGNGNENENKSQPPIAIKPEENKPVRMGKDSNINRCKKLLTSWRLMGYYDKMKEKGWKDPANWYKLSDDHLKYHLHFKNGHIVRFKRKLKEWSKFTQPSAQKKGVHLCKELLTRWRLVQYFDGMLEYGWQEPTDWLLLTGDELKNELHFKRGHAVRFRRKCKEWSNKQSKLSKKKKKNPVSSVAVIKKRKRKRRKLDFEAIDCQQLWRVVEDGIATILISDVNAIKISIDYFAFFGKFKISFDTFVERESLMKRGLTKFTNMWRKKEHNVNDNMVRALQGLTDDIRQFSAIKKEFSVTINKLKELAMDCIEDCVRITPSAQTFKTAQINREKYQNIYLRKKEVYDSKVLGLNDEFDKLFTQKLRLCAQKTTLEYEMQQRKK